jgi:predicted DNA-binding antitoxin AbrB/MazE fold protein
MDKVNVFLCLYEYGTLKPVKVILRRGEKGKNNGRVNQTRVYSRHV